MCMYKNTLSVHSFVSDPLSRSLAGTGEMKTALMGIIVNRSMEQLTFILSGIALVFPIRKVILIRCEQYYVNLCVRAYFVNDKS